MKFITGEMERNGGALLLEQAVVKKDGSPLLFATVCDGHGEAQHALTVKAGEWFQNKLAIWACGDRKNKMPGMYLEKNIACASLLLVGEEAWLYNNSERCLVYIIRKEFGKYKLIKLENSEEIQNFSIEAGISFLLFSVMSTDVASTESREKLFEDSAIAECLMSGDNEPSLERSLREITEGIDDFSCICVKTASE